MRVCHCHYSGGPLIALQLRLRVDDINGNGLTRHLHPVRLATIDQRQPVACRWLRLVGGDRLEDALVRAPELKREGVRATTEKDVARTLHPVRQPDGRERLLRVAASALDLYGHIDRR